MATGESLRSLSFSFRISQSYITRIIQLVLKSLSTHLTPVLLKPPLKEDLVRIAHDFWHKWNFPNCVGAIDGKHICIFSPKKSRSLFFNYKDLFSIVLLAIVDANCKFLFVDIVSYGKEGDSGIFNKSSISQIISTGEYFPSPEKLPDSNASLLLVHIGDEAFRLDRHMMRVLILGLRQEKIIKRLCSTTDFPGVFYTPISLKTETVDNLVLTASCLHNLLRDRYLENTNYYYYNFDDKTPQPSENMMSLARTGEYTNFEGFFVRGEFNTFFNSPQGAVPWQNHQSINRLE
ncbi:hypothetical protein QTP88_000815 [Uroleucon formosanum]